MTSPCSVNRSTTLANYENELFGDHDPSAPRLRPVVLWQLHKLHMRASSLQ